MESPTQDAIEKEQGPQTAAVKLPQALSGMNRYYADRPPVDEGADSWVVTYIDVITLLLTMFVMLLALSGQDSAKYEQAQESLKGVVTRPAEAGQERKNIQRKMAEFTARLEQKDVAQQIAYRFEQGRMVMDLGAKILFPSAEASLSSSGFDILKQLLPVLNDPHYTIVIEGHTDDVPISNRNFASNWQLSAVRAANVVRYLSEQGIDPKRLSAVGFADTRPIADNASAAGRAKNRRVTFKVSYKE